MQNLGRIITHVSGNTNAALQLYNAGVKVLSPVYDPSWPDMDTFISIQGENLLFYGGAPTNASSCSNKFQLSQDLISTPRRIRAERNIYLVPSVSAVFAKCYSDVFFYDKTDLKNGDKLTTNSLKMLLDKAWLQKDTSRSEQDTSTSVEQFSLPYQGTLKDKRQAKNPPNLSPIQLLDALCITLNNEHRSLNFDYLSLHIRSSNLLRKIHT